jgi:hypothetical protein
MACDDRDIWKVALLLIETHGAVAPEEAERRARSCLEGGQAGDVAHHGIWVTVAQCCRTLLRARPHAGEHVH